MIKIIKIVCGSEMPLLETVLREHKLKKKKKIFLNKAFAKMFPVIEKVWNSMRQLK